MKALRDGSGLLLVLISFGVLFYSVSELRQHDYVGAILLAVVGLSMLRGGVELLRPTVGE